MSDVQLRPGDRYGPYEILDKIGRGAFATVYKVRAPRIDEITALKVSQFPMSDSTSLERALREIAILRQLTSDHVVRIFDAGKGNDGRVFILMELLEGQPLERYHDEANRMPPLRAIEIVHQASLGLAEAHAHGIVHRDLKPENLWIDLAGNVKVLDFGLARAWNTPQTIGANVTIGHMLIGTPRYMQPEQLKTATLTPASDVYSLGIILFELITGRTIFFPDQPLPAVRARLNNDPIGWIRAHAKHPAIRLDAVDDPPDVPEGLVELVDRCLDKDPARRPRDAGQLSRLLGDVLHYELGAALGATLRIAHPYGAVDERLVLPGSYRIGSDSGCDIVLRDDKVQPFHAILDWQGLPRYPQLRPIVADGSIRLHDRPVGRRIRLLRSDQITIGPFRLDFEYPDGG